MAGKKKEKEKEKKKEKEKGKKKKVDVVVYTGICAKLYIYEVNPPEPRRASCSSISSEVIKSALNLLVICSMLCAPTTSLTFRSIPFVTNP